MNKIYTFTMEGAGASLKESPKLIVRDNGITLHFFRYAYFLKEDKNDIQMDYHHIFQQEVASVDKIAIKDKILLPELEKFYLARTFLNSGYIYIVANDNKKTLREYVVTSDGYILSIRWKKGNNGDVRKVLPEDSNEKFTDIIVPSGTYYIAYSPFQWTKKIC